MRHTVRMLERAGADCIQLEDQVAPKRCGHFSGKEVISTEEAVSKIKAAVDARTDPDFLIMARTDAAATHGFEAAVERAQRFAEAGADILFVEAVTTAEEIRALPQRLGPPQLMNMVIGGKTPIFGAEELGALGYGIVLYANAALQGARGRHAEGADRAARHQAHRRGSRAWWRRSPSASGWSASRSGMRWRRRYT